LKDRMDTLAKNNYKSTDVELEAAKAQDQEEAKDKADAAKVPASDSDSPDDTDADAGPPVVFDIQLRESLRIMADWIRLEGVREKADANATKVAASKDATTVSSTATVTAGGSSAVQPLPGVPAQPADATR